MDKSISFQDVKACYRIEGKGTPVLMLHGFGEDSTIWDTVWPHLKNHQVILPDLPGSSLSEALLSDKVSMNDLATCIAKILDHEGIDKVHFIGHSLGGYIAMEFANLYPARLLSLVLFHSSAYADDEEKKETRRKSIDFIQANGAKPFLKTSIPGLFADPDAQSETIEQLIVKSESFSAKVLVQYYEAMIARADHSTTLSDLKCPVLFIMGEHDKAVPLNLSLKQCYLAPVSFVHILRSSAHMGMCEEPDKMNAILHDFLEEATKG